MSQPTGQATYTLREDPRRTDSEGIRDIVSRTGFFRDDEVAVAVELIDERLAKGSESTYQFVFAEQDGRMLGYTCFGLIPCTLSSYDLYWIAVDPNEQGRGLGRALVEASEHRIRSLGGMRVYIETSGRDLYVPTQQFYVRCGYHQEAVLNEFYGPGDAKIIYVKTLG